MPSATGDQTIPTIHIEPTNSPSPSPLPTHVRPHNTRNSSYSSTASSRSRQPHPQQHEYVPSSEPGTAGLGERWQFEQAENDARSEGSAEEDTESLEEEEEPAWDNLRDGSVSRRPAWRRPSPGWIFPVIVGATLTLGMGIAPKSEIYVNLACLAVGPRQSEDHSLAFQSFHRSVPDFDHSSPWLGDLDGGLSINNTVPPALPVYHPSPADEWFRKIQREKYDYELNHGLHINGSTPRRPSPSSPIPRPGPSDPREPDHDDPTPSTPKERPPYHEIDPRSCKHDPKVQAATAKLFMCKPYCMTELTDRDQLVFWITFGLDHWLLGSGIRSDWPNQSHGCRRIQLLSQVGDTCSGSYEC
jgi:hypothetical protein